MKRLTLASLVIGSALIAGMGFNMPSYSDFDTDKNGKITQTEFENAQKARMTKQAEAGKMMRNAGNAPTFKNMDTNNDGVIDTSEFSKHQQEQRAKMGQSINK
ncbi:EF-hand domain-containing protein [bacterium]|nr:EF-hand domain-containing protein [bacterium]MBU1995282.1 EF-hand domain-containing protein [bacterium]